jgi:hypothetical protein
MDDRPRSRCAEEGFFDARGDPAGEGRRGPGGRVRRQHRRADGAGALPAQDGGRHRPPAIATHLPNAKGGATTVLDLGANVDCTEQHLLQFAVMGSAWCPPARGHDSPSVGLLNIGEEVIKGNDMIKKAGELLRAAANRAT